MVPTPSRSATRRIDSAASPSASATSIAARTIRSTLRAGLGPAARTLGPPPQQAQGEDDVAAVALLVAHCHHRRTGYDVRAIEYTVLSWRCGGEAEEGSGDTSDRRSSPKGCTSASATPGRWTGSTWPSPRARCAGCSAPTGPARPRRSGCSPPCCGLTPAGPEVAGFDVASQAAQVRYQIGLTGQQPAVDEILTGRENLAMWGRLFHLDRRTARRRADQLLEQFGLAAAAGKRVKHYWEGCGAGSTWQPASSWPPRCCSSTSRRPVSTRATATRAGRPSAPWSPGHHRAADDPVPGRGRPARRPDRGDRRRQGHRRRHPRPAQVQDRRRPGRRRPARGGRTAGRRHRRARAPRSPRSTCTPAGSARR